MSQGILFPHQLFEQNVLTTKCQTIYLIEEYLFFRQYPFHKQKIALHRASMKFYESYLQSKKINVVYIDADSELSDIRKLIAHFKTIQISTFHYIDTTDYLLERRINHSCKTHHINAQKNTSPLFLNAPEVINEFFASKKRFFQTDFYKHQRISRHILLNKDNSPAGGKWTFDDVNRLKYPANKVPPSCITLLSDQYYNDAITYTLRHFATNPGYLNTNPPFPINFIESKKWLENFFRTRLTEFGPYEDAIVSNEHYLHHSVLTPMLNIGLLTPQFILDKVLDYAKHHDVPINSLEGFIRQIVGWREFIRAVYELKGNEERTKNYWGFTRSIPASFWDGTTSIEPIDTTIKKVLKTGYCHHIERLMVLGNFMLLCEFNPDEVYKWFMALFIDAYDWVMVPNVYGMSQFADGGLMATKPYISGSNYLMKMSDYKKGDWQKVWDGLFWRFLDKHSNFFSQNPRLGMLVKTFEKMDEQKRDTHLKTAENYLLSL
jgi:deoxyribodipyrimidine photolyase-related protein